MDMAGSLPFIPENELKKAQVQILERFPGPAGLA
jgi:hypothetical protein